jgi:hypothetical protein
VPAGRKSETNRSGKKNLKKCKLSFLEVEIVRTWGATCWAPTRAGIAIWWQRGCNNSFDGSMADDGYELLDFIVDDCERERVGPVLECGSVVTGLTYTP